MQSVVVCGAAVPWVVQIGLERRYVVWGLSRRSALAAGREFIQFRKCRRTSPAQFSSLSVPYPLLTSLERTVECDLLSTYRLLLPSTQFA